MPMSMSAKTSTIWLRWRSLLACVTLTAKGNPYFFCYDVYLSFVGSLVHMLWFWKGRTHPTYLPASLPRLALPPEVTPLSGV